MRCGMGTLSIEPLLLTALIGAKKSPEIFAGFNVLLSSA